MNSTWQAMLASQRGFILEQLFGDACVCLPEGLCDSHLSGSLRPVAGQVICDYHGQRITVKDLAQRLQDEVRGHRSIPEDMEYAYASKVVSACTHLGPITREALQIYTGYTERSVHRLAREASHAVTHAHASLYGSSVL